MPQVIIPVGDEDRFWVADSIPEGRTEYWHSSGISGSGTAMTYRDDRPALYANGSMTSSDALSTDDTTSYARLDNINFDAATNSPWGPGEGFRMGINASMSGPSVDLPPASALASASMKLVIVHRSVGGGTIDADVYTDDFSAPIHYYYSTYGEGALTDNWARTELQTTMSYLGYSPDSYEHVRSAASRRALHILCTSYDLVVYDVAYLGLVIDYELLAPTDVYDAPRRVSPRDDGAVGGGAPRTWPPSKAAQSSNRLLGAPGTIV